ncbi:hypothetical protein A3860_33775 [Niastella vici]|uniref:Uncharacterized protein n=1 Tax=Niastella vici TaxID=1703345 RepID=A0A1V9FQ05_9BACT|nr:hypothetical protein A3860_33775 [Niastella vici]
MTLHMQDGRKMIFYYAFLLSVELLLKADHSIVILRFTSQKVTLKGYRLDILFNRYAHEKPAVIQVYNGRYILAAMKRLAVVTEVTIELIK